MIDPATNQGIAIIPLGSAMGAVVPSTGLAVSPTGPFAGDIYVGSPGGIGTNQVQVIDPATNMVVDTITIAPRARRRCA